MAGTGSNLRTACSVLALVAAAAAANDATAQPFDPVARDIRTGVFRGQVVTYEVIDGLAVWDGDIILGTPEDLRPDGGPILAGTPENQTKISSVSDKQDLWPRGVIPYTIDPNLTNPHVSDAIRHWEEHTPIRFIERTDQNRWLRFRRSGRRGACLAVIGQFSYELRWTDIYLGENCGLGAAIHEIAHAVGLWHEQERNDRGQHIWVAPSHESRSGAYGLDSGPYDYGSVMHYPCRGTRVTIPPGIPCGSDALSAGDIDGVNRLYGKIPAETRVTTNPAGLLIEVDGETYTAPHSFDWAPGSKHTIGVPAPQKFEGNYLHFPSDFYRFLFAKWSDGGAQTHSVTASSETTVFIANFILQTRTEYSAYPPHGGTIRVEPPSTDGFHTRYSSIKLFPEPAEGFSFLSWGSWASGVGPASNPKVTTRGRLHEEARFTRLPLTKIDTNVQGVSIEVDGARRFLPQNFVWEAGSTHTLGLLVRENTGHEGVIQPSFVTGERLVFDGWSDGSAETHDITITEERPTITANFRRQVVLDTWGGSTITVDPPGSDDGYHDLSSTVWLTAQWPGREFVSWRGDLSGSENPQTLLMDSPKQVAARFMDWGEFRTGKIDSGKPVSLLFGTSTDPRSVFGRRSTAFLRDYWILVPEGATKLEVHLETNNRRGAIDLHANYGFRPYVPSGSGSFTQYLSAHSSTGTSRDKSIVITPESSPPLRPGVYFINVHQRTYTGIAQGKLKVDLSVAEAEIAAKVPHFGIPASLITTREGEVPPLHILEVRNAGEGVLNYQIATDQPWLSVSPDQGTAMEETDVIEIRADPTAMEPGAFEGTITITEEQPGSGRRSSFAPPTPWPLKVPVTFIIIPESREDPSGTTPTMPEGDEEEEGDSEGDEDGSEGDEDGSEGDEEETEEVEDESEGDEEEEDDSEDDQEVSGGPAVDAKLTSPHDVEVDAAGNLYISDANGRRIRRVDSSGAIYTIAGTGVEGYSGDSGPAVDAQLRYPAYVSVDANGNLFFSEYFNHSIRRVDSSGIITTVAGTGVEGFSGDGGPAVQAELAYPGGVAVDASGNLFISDTRNRRIRKVDSSGNISTFVALSGSPQGMEFDAAGNLFIANGGFPRIIRVDPSGTITTIAGTGRSGFSGDGGPATSAHLAAPNDVAVDAAGNLYIADENNHRIRKVDSSGRITTIAGTGVPGFSGDGGPAVQALLARPRGVAVDTAGNVYIADHDNGRIRKVAPSGTITTIAGTGERGR